MIGPAPLSRSQKARSLALQRVSRRDDGLVLYSSFAGRFSDNPRGVYEAMVRSDPDLTHLWHSEGQLGFPGPTVQLDDPDWPRVLGRAAAVVANASLPQYAKPRGATYLQTWHGTPLKRIGLDNPQRVRGTAGHRRAIRDYAQWDALVSQNPHSSKVFRRAFGFDGELLEVGYPRNDALLAPDATAVRDRVRRALGLEDRRAVLYAPTFRDDQVGQPLTALPLDLARVQQALPGTVVLLRLHHWVRGALGDLHGAVDVSDWGDIRELYLAADVLVSDYSSAVFDFAVTGKPIALLTPDLDHYRETLRGLYLDLVEQAPGPVCRTTDELVDALGDDLPAYPRFREEFCPWDDGRAGERVAAWLRARLGRT